MEETPEEKTKCDWFLKRVKILVWFEVHLAKQREQQTGKKLQ